MRDSLPSARYSPVCNVLRQWKTSLILTYRVYRLYDNIIMLGETLSSENSISPLDLSVALGPLPLFNDIPGIGHT